MSRKAKQGKPNSESDIQRAFSANGIAGELQAVLVVLSEFDASSVESFVRVYGFEFLRSAFEARRDELAAKLAEILRGEGK